MGGVVEADVGTVTDVFSGITSLVLGNQNTQQQSSNTQQSTMTTGAAPSGGGVTIKDEEEKQRKGRAAGIGARKMTIPIISNTTTANTGNTGVGANTGGTQ